MTQLADGSHCRISYCLYDSTMRRVRDAAGRHGCMPESPTLASTRSEGNKYPLYGSFHIFVYVLLSASCFYLMVDNSRIYGSSTACRIAAWRLTASTRSASQANQPVRLFIGVLSRASNAEVRQAIRDTWGKDERLAGLKFVVLRPGSDELFRAVRDEAAAYEDIIVVANRLEHYHNITYSTLELFRAAALMGKGVTHVLKTDDDCYVRVDLMLEALAKTPKHWMYGGRPIDRVSRVVRDPRSKAHFVPYSNWASDALLPPYAFGLGAVLTMDLVKHIAAGAAYVTMAPENLLRLEDVSTGIWVDTVAKEQQQQINYVELPFEIRVCRSTDALTHMYKSLWPSTADAHRCLYNDSCAYQCTEAFMNNTLHG